MQNDVVHFIGKPVKHSRDSLQEYHDRFKAAHKRELAEKDAEIERLKKACDLRRDSNDAYQHCIEAYKRVFRAQITDLTGALSGALDIISSVGEYIGTKNSVEVYRETLAKAREALELLTH